MQRYRICPVPSPSPCLSICVCGTWLRPRWEAETAPLVSCLAFGGVSPVTHNLTHFLSLLPPQWTCEVLQRRRGEWEWKRELKSTSLHPSQGKSESESRTWPRQEMLRTLSAYNTWPCRVWLGFGFGFVCPRGRVCFAGSARVDCVCSWVCQPQHGKATSSSSSSWS